MRKEKDDVNEKGDGPQEPSQLERLTLEKISLATKLGLMGKELPKDENYKQTKEYKRIEEIDKLLWELI